MPTKVFSCVCSTCQNVCVAVNNDETDFVVQR